MTIRELDVPDSVVEKSFDSLDQSIDLLGETANRIADELLAERQKTKRLRAANRALVKALNEVTTFARPGSPVRRTVEQALEVNAEAMR